uniref:Uncharacterized protein n=1 Tax=Rhizophora mucronata TaxID=61149 RepID=A0A2P2LMK9_RHIMU
MYNLKNLSKFQIMALKTDKAKDNKPLAYDRTIQY